MGTSTAYGYHITLTPHIKWVRCRVLQSRQINVVESINHVGAVRAHSVVILEYVIILKNHMTSILRPFCPIAAIIAAACFDFLKLTKATSP